MKEGIHPAYNQTTITCACGNVIEVGSTKKDLKVDVCSKCHPYWTGNLRLDTKGGRADKFKKKYGLAKRKHFKMFSFFISILNIQKNDSMSRFYFKNVFL